MWKQKGNFLHLPRQRECKKKLGSGSKGAPSKFIDDKMRGLLFIFAFIPWVHCSAACDSGRWSEKIRFCYRYRFLLFFSWMDCGGISDFLCDSARSRRRETGREGENRKTIRITWESIRNSQRTKSFHLRLLINWNSWWRFSISGKNKAILALKRPAIETVFFRFFSVALLKSNDFTIERFFFNIHFLPYNYIPVQMEFYCDFLSVRTFVGRLFGSLSFDCLPLVFN